MVVVVAAPARANPELGAPNQMPILGKVHAPVLLDDDASQVFFFLPALPGDDGEGRPRAQ